MDGTITRYVYDRLSILLEYDDTGVLIARYTHGDIIDQPLSMQRDGQRLFYHADHQASIRKITDAGGAVFNSYDYMPTGESRAWCKASPIRSPAPAGNSTRKLVSTTTEHATTIPPPGDLLLRTPSA